MRPSRRLQLTRLLTVGLLGGFAFLAGHYGHRAAVDSGPSKMSAMAEASELVEVAQSAAAERQPTQALASYQRAYDLSQDPTLLLEVARLERQLGNAARATHALEAFLEQGSDRVHPARYALARRQLRDAAVTTARLHLQTNVQGAALDLEPQRGVATTSGFTARAVLDAGERTLTLSKPGYETRTVLVNLIPGEVRTLRLDLEKAAGRSETWPNKPRWTRLDTAR